MDVLCPSCLAKHWMAERRSDSSDQHPKFGMCCQKGNIWLPPLEDLPAELQELYESDTPLARHFRTNIRHFNNALAMTSLGEAAGRRLRLDTSAPWVYKVQGAMHHIMGSLLPDDAHPPSYAQLYYYDAEIALEYRLRNATPASVERDGHVQTQKGISGKQNVSNM